MAFPNNGAPNTIKISTWVDKFMNCPHVFKKRQPRI